MLKARIWGTGPFALGLSAPVSLPTGGDLLGGRTAFAPRLIALMIAIGLLLRHSPIPTHYLAVGYTAIGTALFLSGVLVGKECRQGQSGGGPRLNRSRACLAPLSSSTFTRNARSRSRD